MVAIKINCHALEKTQMIQLKSKIKLEDPKTITVNEIIHDKNNLTIFNGGITFNLVLLTETFRV